MSRPPLPANMSLFAPKSANKGQMLALDIDTGKTLWAFTPKRLSSESNSYFGGHLTSPVVVDGTVFVGAGKEVYALDAASGAVRWEFARQGLYIVLGHRLRWANLHLRFRCPLCDRSNRPAPRSGRIPPR